MGKGGGAGGHCQVPCGIFDDPKLVADVREACATVRKAMSKIEVPSEPRHQPHAADEGALRCNQNSRWVATKDDHCETQASLFLSLMLMQHSSSITFFFRVSARCM